MLLPKIKKIPKNTNGRLAIPALAGLLVLFEVRTVSRSSVVFFLAKLMMMMMMMDDDDDKKAILDSRSYFFSQRSVSG